MTFLAAYFHAEGFTTTIFFIFHHSDFYDVVVNFEFATSFIQIVFDPQSFDEVGMFFNLVNKRIDKKNYLPQQNCCLKYVHARGAHPGIHACYRKFCLL